MTHSPRLVHTFGLGAPPCAADADVLGGKGASLVAMTAAALPVPPGFVIVTDCCRQYHSEGGRWPEGLEAQVRAALDQLRRLAAPPSGHAGESLAPLLVAVRSGAAQSMPGMMDTVLNCPVEPFERLRDAINAVFESWNSPRAVAYRAARGIGDIGTAVTVQAMFPSEVSGVAFTRDPNAPEADTMIVEAARGLGDAVVSGKVTPDRFVVSRGPGHAVLGSARGGAPADLRDAETLSPAQLPELAELAINVERQFGKPMDIEWALAAKQWALLQCRPIAGIELAGELAAARRDELARLRTLSSSGRRVWVAHNIGETLRNPTPLTWDVIGHFMSGDGGFGRMYVQLGYRPSRRVRQDGFLELIAGRPYADANRAAELFWDALPLAYDLDSPGGRGDLLDRAPTRFDPDRAGPTFLLRLPGTLLAMIRAWRRAARARRQAVEDFQSQLAPFLDYVGRERSRDLRSLGTPALLEEFHDRRRRVLDDFGCQSLKPGFFAGMAMASLEDRLTLLAGCDEGRRLAATLATADEPDMTLAQNIALAQAGAPTGGEPGQDGMSEFLDRFGHRAMNEMELAQPRWREQPQALAQLARRLAASARTDAHAQALERREAACRALPRMLAHWGGSSLADDIRRDMLDARRLLPCRESAKHYLMMGYELIRQAALELGRRWELGDDVFFLRLDELESLEGRRRELADAIAARKLRHRVMGRLDAPDVIDSRCLDELWEPPQTDRGSGSIKAQAIATGIATGPAAVVRDLADAGELGSDYILVCPSTDPGWTVLFMNARGLVVERGGILSHGAIVARDLGIPAVICPAATSIIAHGRMVRIDGNHGSITLLGGLGDA